MQIETVDVACSTCGSRDADEVGRSRDHEFATCDNEFVFVRCRACGLTYLRNRPAPHTLGIIYPPSYYRYAAFLGPVTTRLRAVVQGGRVRMLRRWLSPGATVMEVGCGEGQLLQAIKADGDPSWRVVGVDISEDACEALRRTGLEMRCAQFEELDWPEATVDLVIMNQVIEHLADPRACVARAAALLRPGGLLLIETPSVGSWDRDWVAPDRWGGWHCPRHWSLYTRDSLSALAGAAGAAGRAHRVPPEPVHLGPHAPERRPRSSRMAVGVGSPVGAIGAGPAGLRRARHGAALDTRPDVEHAGRRPQGVAGLASESRDEGELRSQKRVKGHRGHE